MALIFDVYQFSFESIWNGRKPFYILRDPQNKHDLFLNHVISFRERNDETNMLTGREISANSTYIETIPPYISVIGLLVYQRLDFEIDSRSKRKI